MTTKRAKKRLDESEPDEGTQNAERFESVLSSVLKVSKQDLAKREAAYQKSRRRKKRRAARPSAR